MIGSEGAPSWVRVIGCKVVVRMLACGSECGSVAAGSDVVSSGVFRRYVVVSGSDMVSWYRSVMWGVPQLRFGYAEPRLVEVVDRLRGTRHSS